ncbi:AMP-binding protein [Pseudonocardia sp. KRD-184]|uniref:AMP-binding protein n=1 Tax=Pseudonocardia oceani TaxID=2792013 RepID=A0ABS6UEJ2_9PSEU|nr:AMP-binding protein [Pseudonocardia oceani]MBW0091193.1 AMP-binding protein [Pseudonocardia oceani]MBW0098288.1 AMP-binding protein [Pseudonocardia oceani]MBW0110829.1 AMP-binding protein [Pseudonocardia oceani]MBW0121690.1 AMP-binding protein [Pseudonocardia oceani]MBW0130652.1 AMP-binding protein [Pseudonocardia oceani]
MPGIQPVLHTINLRLSPAQQEFTMHRIAQPVDSCEDLLAAADGNAPFAEFDEKAAAAMRFTSATTGDPKGVVYSHRAMVLPAMVLAMHDKLDMAERQIWLVVLPGAHPTPADYVDIIEDLGVTSIGAFFVRSPFTAGEYYRDERTPGLEDRRPAQDRRRRLHRPRGYVLLEDRSEDLLRSGGEWISTIDLENAFVPETSVGKYDKRIRGVVADNGPVGARAVLGA